MITRGGTVVAAVLVAVLTLAGGCSDSGDETAQTVPSSLPDSTTEAAPDGENVDRLPILESAALAMTAAGFTCTEPAPRAAGDGVDGSLASFSCDVDRGAWTMTFDQYPSAELAQDALHGAEETICAESWGDTATLLEADVVVTSEALQDLRIPYDQVVASYDEAFAALGHGGPLTCQPPA